MLWTEYVRVGVDVLRLVIEAVALLAGYILFQWFSHGLYPVLKLRIEFKEHSSGVLFIGLEVTNTSRVYARLIDGKVKARLRIVELDNSQMSDSSNLSEWVSFDDNSIPVMTSTTYIEPGESIRIERLHPLSSTTVAVHCGFQVRPDTPRIVGQHNPTGSFTTTAWALLSGTESVTENAAA